MTRTRAWCSAVLTLATLSLAPRAPAAAPDEGGLNWTSIELPGRGGFELPAPAAWKVEVHRFLVLQPPTIEYKPPEGKGFSVLITASWGAPGKPQFNDPAHVLKIVKWARDQAVDWATTRHIDIVELKGERLAGYYFSAIDRNPKPGEWKYMTHGWAAFEDLLLEFTILSPDAAQPETAATLIMLQKAKRTHSD
jgi:hypothetical protein